MNKIKLINLAFIATISLVFVCSCQKSNNTTTKKAKNQNIYLAHLPTDTIETYLNGRWRVRCMVGGNCGSCRYDRDYLFEYYTFLPNRRIIYSFQNSIFSDTTYSWSTYQEGSGDYIHNILSSRYASFEIEKIFNDTLIVAMPFINNPDFSRFYMTQEN